MHAPVLVTAPAEYPVSVTDALAQCRIDGSDEVALVTLYLGAATAHLDGYSGVLGRCLVTQTWRQDFDGFSQCMRLPLPATSITSVKWLDEAAASTTIASTNYVLRKDAVGSYVRFNDDYAYPTDLGESAAVQITFVAGYGAAADVPASIRHAILLMVGHWYDHRSAVNVGDIVAEMPFAVDALIAPYRRIGA